MEVMYSFKSVDLGHLYSQMLLASTIIIMLGLEKPGLDPSPVLKPTRTQEPENLQGPAATSSVM